MRPMEGQSRITAGSVFVLVVSVDGKNSPLEVTHVLIQWMGRISRAPRISTPQRKAFSPITSAVDFSCGQFLLSRLANICYARLYDHEAIARSRLGKVGACCRDMEKASQYLAYCTFILDWISYCLHL